MTYRRYPQTPLNDIGATTQSIVKPRLSRQAMASVIVGAGDGTTSIQLSGSNDNVNFTAIGSAVTATNRAVPLNADNQVYLHYRAVTTTITDVKATQVIFFFN